MHQFLKSLSEEEQALLIQLPYRVGLFISSSDSSGGAEAEMKEHNALSSVVMSFVEDTCKSEFAQSVMELTLGQRARWSEWKQAIDSVPAESARAIALLIDRIDRKYIEAFKNNLIEIGIAVAIAHREDERADLAAVLSITVIEKLKSLMGFGGSLSSDLQQNISAKEKQALDILAHELGLPKNYMSHI